MGGIEVEIVPVGTKVGGYFRRRGVEFPSEYNCPQVPSAEFASTISNEMLNKFLDGETDKVELIYTQFVSLIASAPKLKTLLPLSATGIETEGDEMFELTTDDGALAVETSSFEPAEAKVFPKDTIFEQDPVAILNGILPLYLDGQILLAPGGRRVGARVAHAVHAVGVRQRQGPQEDALADVQPHPPGQRDAGDPRDRRRRVRGLGIERSVR